MGRHAAAVQERTTNAVQPEQFTSDGPPWAKMLWSIVALLTALGVVLALATSNVDSTSSSSSTASGSSASTATTFPDGLTIDFEAQPVASYMAEVYKSVNASHVEPYKEYWVRLGWKACDWGKQGYSRDGTATGIERFWITTIGVPAPTTPTTEAAAYTMSLIVVNSAWSSGLCSA